MDRDSLFNWFYDAPYEWGGDAHHTALYMRNHRAELRDAVEAVRAHFIVLVQGPKKSGALRYTEATRIQYAALDELPRHYTSFSSQDYLADITRVLRGNEPKNGLARMLRAFEKAAITCASQSKNT